MILLTESGQFDSFVQFITVLLLFLFVLVITYVVTRWLSGVQKAQMAGKNMELIETMRISNSKYIQIMRAGDRYLVIAVCKDTVTLLAELSKEELSFSLHNERADNLSFREIFDKIKPEQNRKDNK